MKPKFLVHSGLHGNHGEIVPRHVALVRGLDLENVHLVAVLGMHCNLKSVILIQNVQLGQNGHNLRNVQKIAEVESNLELAIVCMHQITNAL